MNKNILIALTVVNSAVLLTIVGLVIWVALPGTPSPTEITEDVADMLNGGEPLTGDGDIAELTDIEDDRRHIAMSANEYGFNPSTINISADERAVVIELTNNGSMPHNFTVDAIEGMSISSPTINPGETANLHIDIPSGVDSMPFYCSLENHRELGMEGEFIIQQN